MKRSEMWILEYETHVTLLKCDSNSVTEIPDRMTVKIIKLKNIMITWSVIWVVEFETQ